MQAPIGATRLTDLRRLLGRVRVCNGLRSSQGPTERLRIVFSNLVGCSLALFLGWCQPGVKVQTLVSVWNRERTIFELFRGQVVRQRTHPTWTNARTELRICINRLRTGEGEPLFLIEAPEGSYRLTPHDPGFEKKMAKAEDIISRYRNTLRVLSK